MDFYIVRHGQTDFNTLGYYQGCLLNPSLNEYGIEQAKRLRQKMSDNGIIADRIFSSPLRRAYETARRLTTVFSSMVIDADLIEGDFGIADGAIEEEIKTKLPEEYAKWKDLDNLQFAFKNGQSKEEIGLRMSRALWNIYHHYNNLNNVLIVSHSCAIRCLLLQLGIKEENIPFGTIYHLQINTTDFSSLKFIERID